MIGIIDSPRVGRMNPIKIQPKDSAEMNHSNNNEELKPTHSNNTLPFRIKNLDTGEITMQDPFFRDYSNF